jgi:hypothetical protein
LSQFFVYLAIALALSALWSVTMPLVVRALVLRREKNEDLVNWRSAIAQFEAAHGRLPQQLTVREIGDRFIERDWDHPEEINQLVKQVTLMLFSPHSNKQDSTSELLAFVTAHAAQLPWQIRALRRLSPRLAWKLAGGAPQR